jgi:chromosome segregation ATPase
VTEKNEIRWENIKWEATVDAPQVMWLYAGSNGRFERHATASDVAAWLKAAPVEAKLDAAAYLLSNEFSAHIERQRDEWKAKAEAAEERAKNAEAAATAKLNDRIRTLLAEAEASVEPSRIENEFQKVRRDRDEWKVRADRREEGRQEWKNEAERVANERDELRVKLIEARNVIAAKKKELDNTIRSYEADRVAQYESYQKATARLVTERDHARLRAEDAERDLAAEKAKQRGLPHPLVSIRSDYDATTRHGKCRIEYRLSDGSLSVWTVES